ncbi:FecR family protein [Larkinella rosea]|uniref:FecR family protein n=1 Tax=Larkinella rosea TaxID=2025312 RepID=A0A3P1BJE0_9BACT|nr:FecR family protein [Larkinella rosea]RRB01016.1 FecR family protein [Larkinella rosea]
MQKEEFVRLLTKYNQGQCTDAEIRLIDRWYDQLGADSAFALSDEERQRLKKRLWQKIDLQTTEETETTAQPAEKPLRRPVFRQWFTAAAVAVLIGFGTLFFYQNPSNPLERVLGKTGSETGFEERTNTTSQAQLITLNDGSIVHLQPQSTIRYATQPLPQKREIWLNGKAFFRVQKDASRPFLVYSSNIVTRVLGTSFWITANTNAPTVEVAVHTGKVAVFKKDRQSMVKPEEVEVTDKTGVVLTPNQKVTFFIDENRVTRGLIDQPEPIRNPVRPEPATFVFDDSPLPEVLKQLESQYGIEMEIGNEVLTECRFTGNITRQPLYTKLELICQSINARYEVQGTRILINGTGCNP